VGDNLRAIQLTVAALRGIERWGSTGMVTAAFTGFSALPARSTAGEPAWWEVLGINPQASVPEIETAFRERANAAHPDIGGSAEAFHQVTRAYRMAKELRA
jgi:hypothetical protein